MQPRILVQTADFDPGAEIDRLSGDPGSGAVASFVGLVRNHGDRPDVTALELEHYPGMTETLLGDIIARAHARWPLTGCTVIHRVGRLPLGARIVLVATASAHRGHAFSACEFIMDWLKTQAPFWKKEITADGIAAWVEAKTSDDHAAERWSDAP